MGSRGEMFTHAGQRARPMPSSASAESGRAANGGSPSKMMYYQMDARRRPAPPAESWVPQHPQQGAGPPQQPRHAQQFRDNSPEKVSMIPKVLQQRSYGRPQSKLPPPPLRQPPPAGFPKTNPMVTPGDSGKRQSSQEVSDRGSPRKELSNEDQQRPRTCPPERSGSADILGQGNSSGSGASGRRMYLPQQQQYQQRPSGAGLLFSSSTSSGRDDAAGVSAVDGNRRTTEVPTMATQRQLTAPQLRLQDRGFYREQQRPSVERGTQPPSDQNHQQRLSTPAVVVDLQSSMEHQQYQNGPSSNSAAVDQRDKRPPQPDRPSPMPNGQLQQPPPPSYPTQLGPRLSDEQLLAGSPRQLLDKFRRAEGEITRLMMEHGKVTRELHRQLQNTNQELRGAQEDQRRFTEENQELRDLCCFLDDDRQKGRKLAREWQRFGRYTAGVMRQEVSAYQSKLRELDTKQQELLKDNLELKELCLYLDEERQGPQQLLCSNCGAALDHPRDDGDGSSSSTAPDEIPQAFHNGNHSLEHHQRPSSSGSDHPQHRHRPASASSTRTEGRGRVGGTTAPPRRTTSQECLLEEGLQRHRSLFNEHILQYIRSLEGRLSSVSLEQTHSSASSDVDAAAGSGSCDSATSVRRPDAVVQAMRVLEVQEHIDGATVGRSLVSTAAAAQLPAAAAGMPQSESAGRMVNGSGPGVVASLEHSEKALVRQMCNVVWKKLEEMPS